MSQLSIFKIFFFILFAFGINLTKAQLVGSEAMKHKNFVFHNNPPKYLLSRKSVVFLSVPPSATNPSIRSDWKKLSTDIHSTFRRTKIDAVGYYHIDDVFSGVDSNEILAKQMTNREVKYVILLEQKDSTENNNQANESNFRITVVPFNNTSTFISAFANAWKVEGYNLENVLNELFKGVVRQEMEMENYLIPDVPEFFSNTSIIKGKRIETYATDLKVDKLIVPKFQRLVIEDSAKLDEASMNKVRALNREIDQKNERLKQIMSTYPLKYEISEDYSDKVIYNKGSQYVLLRLDGTGTSIHQMLGYKNEPGATAYATIKATEVGSTVITLPVESVVSKFYVKHVYTKDVYTGLGWDADLTWEESLQNFIFNMKKALKVN